MFRITTIDVVNYKSLRHIRFFPQALTTLVGPNAAGKSNLADALDFLSEAYRHGLEVAVARKGGYENIAHRKQRRAKGSISLTTEAEYSTHYPNARVAGAGLYDIRVNHSFSFKARGSSISAEFLVSAETFVVDVQNSGVWKHALTVRRTSDGIHIDRPDSLAEVFGASPVQSRIFNPFPGIDYLALPETVQTLPKTELMTSLFSRLSGILRPYFSSMSAIRVFQIYPASGREFGASTPNAELDRSGSNLPAVVDLFRKRYGPEWNLLMQAMRRILPQLEEIITGYTTSRTLGLFFKEIGVGRDWGVDEVSDGTIRTLALLIVLFDPRNSIIVLEEPENSLHAWIVRNIIQAVIDASDRKQIILTTHSPVVVNAVPPGSVWVVWRSHGESRILPLSDMDPGSLIAWEDGHIDTFGLLDSGILQQSIPFPVDPEDK